MNDENMMKKWENIPFGEILTREGWGSKIHGNLKLWRAPK